MASREAKALRQGKAEGELKELLADTAAKYGVEPPDIPQVPRMREEIDYNLALVERDLAFAQFFLAIIEKVAGDGGNGKRAARQK